MNAMAELRDAGKVAVADLVAVLLERIGVEIAFGITSVHNVGLLDAIGRRERIRFVSARGEMGAAHMADGYARAAGRIGVLFTSTGPAAASAAPGLLEATVASTPMLHITGQSAVALIGRGTGAVHDVPDQLAMLKSVSKVAYRAATPEAVVPTLLRAVSEALTPPMGPVSVEIPIDVQRGHAKAGAALESLGLSIPTPAAAPSSAIPVAADLMAKAKRPLLWVGGGAREARPQIERLLGMGFCMITSWNGRGAIPESDPRTLGALNGVLSPIADSFCQGCDLLLVAGSRLRHQQTRDMRLALPQPIVQIDVDPLAQGRTYQSESFLCGDAAATLDALADALEGRIQVDPAFQAEFAAMKSEAVDDLRSRQGPYADFPCQLREVMPADALWVRDQTLNANVWGHHAFPLNSPRDSIFPVGGAIGIGLPLAIGAALGSGGRKTVMMAGDGGFFLNPGEIWTALQERADMVMIVMNDGGYGVIKHLQTASHGGRHFYTDVKSPSLEGLAELAGIPFRRVTAADRFGAAVADMLAFDGPSIVEVDMSRVGALPYTPLPQGPR